MAYAAFRRVASKPRAAVRDNFEAKPFVAPTKGWLSATNLAQVPPGYAYTLENWFPTSTGIRLRRGCQQQATMGSNAIKSLMTYIGGTTRKLFGASTGSISRLDNVASATAAPTADVTGQTSDYYSHLNFATAGGNYMTVVNGTDTAQLYDGTTWTASTITGVTTSKLSHVWAYKNREFFVEKGTMRVWYLPINSITGAAASISLAGVFQKGGSVVLGATWSVNNGVTIDDKIVFISSEGEYAIYQGADPADAATWSLVGLYAGSPPLGTNQNGYMKAGADLLILTQAGIVPLTAIMNKDPAALSISAVTKAIAPDWIAESQARLGLPWEIIKWPSRSYALVNCPVTGSSTPAISFVVNLETGAWCKYTGWDTRCLALHNDYVYFGTNAGTIQQAEVTGADNGALIYHTYVGHMDHLGATGFTKTVKQARATFRTLSVFTPQLSISTDYVVSIPTAPSAASPASSAIWDAGTWDNVLWDVGSVYATYSTLWVSIGKTGYAHAPVLQVTSGSTSPPSAELVLYEVTVERGGLVV